jgi:hypothetical protein
MLMFVMLSSPSSSFALESGCFHMPHYALKMYKLDLQLVVLVELQLDL